MVHLSVHVEGLLGFQRPRKKQSSSTTTLSTVYEEEEEDGGGGGEVWGDVRAIYKDISFYG